MCYFNAICCPLQYYGTMSERKQLRKTCLTEEIYIFVVIFSNKSVVEEYNGWLND